MKLSEKIYCCRKKCGYSQETLARIVGVSRQAVSKWETGESEPEIGKLKLLAETFHVTTDWLLSEDGPEEAAPKNEPVPRETPGGAVRRFFRKHGWISGLILMGYGCLVLFMGFLSHWLIRNMFPHFPGEMQTHNPVCIMGNVFIIIGGVLAVGGLILALCLRHHFGSKNNRRSE